MNVLLVIGLVLFACLVTWIYILFMLNTIDKQPRQTKPTEPIAENALERCRQLYDQGLHSELQRFAQRELSKNYNNVELRRILAQSLMASGNSEMSIMHYEAILAIAPYDVKTQELLAQYYLENGPKSRAIELYEHIFQYDSGNINAVETLAKLYEEVQNYSKAIQMYSMMLDAEVEEDNILHLKYTLADLYSKVGDFPKAYDEYRYIYKQNPDNLEMAIILAELAYKNKYWQDCLNYYEKIIETVGDDYEILQKIAQLHTILEHWEDVIQVYKKLINLEGSDNPNYLYHQNELCNAMLKCGHCNETIDLLKDLILQYPKETSFIFTLAQAYTQTREFQAGIDIYNKLMDLLPHEQGEIIIKYISNLICAWALDLFNKGDYNQAFDKFFEALKFDEENDEVYYQLGKCNYYIKSFQDSIAHFKRAISIKPQNPEYYFGLGCAYDEMGSIKPAKNAFLDAVNIDPTNIKARIAYAISLTKELEYAQAIEQFNEVLKYIPHNADTIYNLALAYEMVGDYERAIKFYKKAIDEDNNHKEANHNLQLLTGETYIPLPKTEKQEEETTTPAEEVKQQETASDIDLEDFQQYM